MQALRIGGEGGMGEGEVIESLLMPPLTTTTRENSQFEKPCYV